MFKASSRARQGRRRVGVHRRDDEWRHHASLLRPPRRWVRDDTVGIHRIFTIVVNNHMSSYVIWSMVIESPMNSKGVSSSLSKPLATLHSWQTYFVCNRCFCFFGFGAFYGSLLVAIVLVPKSCGELSFSELWRPNVEH